MYFCRLVLTNTAEYGIDSLVKYNVYFNCPDKYCK